MIVFVYTPTLHKSHSVFADSLLQFSDIVRVNCNPNNYPSYLLPFIKPNIKTKPSAILAEGGIALPFAVKLKKKFGCPLIMINADTLFYDIVEKKLIKNIYMKKLIKELDGVVAVSKMMKEYADKCVNCPVKVVYPGINIKKFKDISPDLTSHSILFAGKHRPEKRIEQLIEKFTYIKNADKKAELVLAGKLIGDRIDKEILSSAGVIYIGFVDNFTEVMRRSKIVVHYSSFDPCPTAVTEGMVAGLIPVISRGCGNKDFVRLVDKRLVVSDEEFSSRIIELLNSSENKIKKLSEKSRQIASRFSYENSQKEFRKAWTDIIEGA